MTEEIVGSKFKSDNSYGQDGSATPSSVPVKKTPAYNVKNPEASLVRPHDPVLTDPDVRNWQTRGVSAAPIKTAFGMKSPDNSARVPSGTNRRASSIIAPRGSARR
jgi:hypothetical protein